MKHLASIKLTITGVIASLSAFSQSITLQTDTAVLTVNENNAAINYQRWDRLLPVKAEDVPQPLKTVLQRAEYRDWEQGDILRSENGDMYEFRIGTAEEQSVYRFTPQGIPVKSN
jgi:hypothetical protein